jgi:hypothetical protein
MFTLRKLALLGLALSVALTSAGCPGRKGNKPSTPAEEAWIKHFRSEMYQVKSETRLFQEKYIRNNNDTFELRKEIIPAIQSGKELTKYQKAKIRYFAQDYELSWPMLTEQNQRGQVIFGVVAALPAAEAYEIMVKKMHLADPEAADMMTDLKIKLEKNVIFNPQTASYEIVPSAKPEIVELVNKFTQKMLSLLFVVSQNERAASELELKYQTMRLLNPQVAVKVGAVLSPEEAPYIEDPIKTWESLSKVYAELFPVLMSDNVLSQKDKINTLLETEKDLLGKLFFATEKQFQVTEAIIK